ncbi:hypothetical protein Spith_1282 [Spirochaeta thermophila DSM 6578]|uniref:Uncharacterized protein n=1 Tax=Winmispira thermophila (strain ATCC 700085 / DSM 6578 / Z-1203) TaxID=869211 RepID=G0GFD3_WINT7|nr:hypothetical protein [Spirochaeta thermophila]AEJ61547.1 hypothetical protein Spith_1282 [Spirochaeta thermophila DSM 6578]
MRAYRWLLWGVGWSLLASPLWFSSNEMGQALVPIEEFDRGRYEYVLMVEDGEGRQVRVLFREGEEVRRWEIVWHREGVPSVVKVWGDGVLSRVSRYDEGGRLLVEEFYREGEFSERVRYEYEGARVVRRVWEGVDGGTSTEEFRYDREGRLREVRAVPEKGVDRYVQVGGRLVEEWHGDGGSGFLVRYGRSGEVVEREEWEGGRLVWVRTYRYGEGGVCEGWVEERPAEGAVVEVRCDGEGRPVEEVWRREGVSVRRVVYGYEGGRVVWEREVTEGLVRESRYGYEGDRVVWEEVWENGVRVMRREFGEGGAVSAEVVDLGEGASVRRVYGADGRLVREEFFLDGELVSVREAK